MHSATPVMIGQSWLGVEQVFTEPSTVTLSQAQPEPKRVAPAVENFDLNSSNEPKAASIACASLPDGALAPPGCITFQNNEWLKWPPPLLRTAARISSGTAAMSPINSVIDLRCRSSCPSRALFRFAT